VIVQAAAPDHFQWLATRTQGSIPSDFTAIEAVDASGRVHGMIGYSGWTETAVVMHIALDNPASFRHLVYPAFMYPFIQVNRSIALAVVNSANERSLNLCKRVGFTEVYRVKDGYRVGEDQVLFEMRREACRWLTPSRRRAA